MNHSDATIIVNNVDIIAHASPGLLLMATCQKFYTNFKLRKTSTFVKTSMFDITPPGCAIPLLNCCKACK